MYFTVEVVTEPVKDGDWARLREMTDVVPGTLLIEDAEAPMLIFPVESDNPMQAASFIDGVARVAGLELVGGKVYPTPEVDFDLVDDDAHSQPTGRAHRWEPSDSCAARMVDA